MHSKNAFLITLSLEEREEREEYALEGNLLQVLVAAGLAEVAAAGQRLAQYDVAILLSVCSEFGSELERLPVLHTRIRQP